MDRSGMAEIWREVLGCETVQDTDTFFDLGGDSIAAMSLLFRIEEKFGVTVELFEVFEHPRFRDFVDRMSGLVAAA